MTNATNEATALTSPAKFEPVEVAYFMPGLRRSVSGRKVCRTEKQVDALLAKITDAGGWVLACASLD